jgi:MFS family permease
MFSLAVFIPLSGWIADRFGARTVFRSAIIVFTLGSIACGLSGSLWQLVAWVTAPALIGPVLGPPVGGIIVTYASWRWIFLINVPIGIIGYMLATRYIENIRGRRDEPLDLRGFILVALALSGLVFGFETIGRHLVASSIVTGFLCIGVLCVLLYLLHIRNIDHPIIDLGLLKYQTYRASLTGGTIFRISIGALPFLLPLLLQYGFGMTPALSGFITLGSAAGAVLMKICATPIIRFMGFKPVLLINTIINCLFLAGIASFTTHSSLGVIFIFLLIGGFFRSLQFTSLNVIAFAEIPERLLSRANTLYNMMQQLSLSLGVAVGALMLNLTLRSHSSTQLQAHDFGPSFLCVSVLCLLSGLTFIPLAPNAGAIMSGHETPTEEAGHQDPT